MTACVQETACLAPRTKLRPITCPASKCNARLGRRSPRRVQLSILPRSARSAVATVSSAVARSVQVEAAEISRSPSSRCRNSSSLRPTCLRSVCPPRSSSRGKSYRSRSVRGSVAVAFAGEFLASAGRRLQDCQLGFCPQPSNNEIAETARSNFPRAAHGDTDFTL